MRKERSSTGRRRGEYEGIAMGMVSVGREKRMIDGRAKRINMSFCPIQDLFGCLYCVVLGE